MRFRLLTLALLSGCQSSPAQTQDTDTDAPSTDSDDAAVDGPTADSATDATDTTDSGDPGSTDGGDDVADTTEDGGQTSTGDTTSGEPGCWDASTQIGETNGFGGFFARPEGVVDSEGQTWVGFGVFGSITPGFAWGIRQVSDTGFEIAETPHGLLYGVQIIDDDPVTIAATRWSDGVGVQVWRWNGASFDVEDVHPTARHIVGDVADDGSVHLMFAQFDDVVFYATDASGQWEVEELPGVFRPLSLTAHDGTPRALVQTDEFPTTSIATREGERWTITPTGLAQDGFARVHGSSHFLQLDNETDAPWLIDAENVDDSVRLSDDPVDFIADAQWDGDQLHFAWRDFDDNVAQVRWDGSTLETTLAIPGAAFGPGTVAGDPDALIWASQGVRYASCPGE